MTPVLELAVQDVAGARIARRAGAVRVELCTALGATGGLTPSIGMIEAVAAQGIAVHPLIRCRPGGFVYDADEIAVMARDVRAAVNAGASGVVLGALTPDMTVDRDALRRLLDGIDPYAVEVTFHRAMDVVDDRATAVDTLARSGIIRVLTSGGAPRCIDGLDALSGVVAHAHGRIQVMAGGGIRVEDIAAVAGTGVDAVHLSARRTVADSGGPGGGSGGYDAVDETLARAAAEALGL
ncbi:copper homeostasis protein CutC [Rhodococcus sp. IEGM 248]|uniref:copper homeostasis protein CutC n=1 Tax=Rhodococcus opacus TaxID=37919 RepID=UPI0013C16F55|nr:copper homeostasis protein CutC [Rhodococcus opacus]MDV7090807.1 copper homeostasis protein CutC [Rhodococcus opacus]NDV09557.1 copper homeostasis protein CutC [Rhodococcus sp. IEGM 248]